MWRICSAQGWWSLFGRKRRDRAGRPSTTSHEDVVELMFTAQAPNQLRLSDLTEHPTGCGSRSTRGSNAPTTGRRRHAALGRLTPAEYEVIMTLRRQPPPENHCHLSVQQTSVFGTRHPPTTPAELALLRYPEDRPQTKELL